MLATGSVPFVPPGIPIDGKTVSSVFQTRRHLLGDFPSNLPVFAVLHVMTMLVGRCIHTCHLCSEYIAFSWQARCADADRQPSVSTYMLHEEKWLHAPKPRVDC